MNQPYRAPAWLPGRHAQTIYPALFVAAPRLAYRRERWPTPDGDFLDLDWLDGPAASPLLVMFHGLEGSSRSRYVRHLFAAAREWGWSCVLVHFRGCSGEANRLPRAYHSGDSGEADWILRRLATAQGGPVFACGVSLGGNVLLKWLGESGTAAAHQVQAAVAISAPLDVSAVGEHLGRGFNRLYGGHFLLSLKPKALEKWRQFPGLFDRSKVAAATTLPAFDEHFTAPLHGFRGASDYYRQASSKPLLGDVRVPTLLLNARNDPFTPSGVLPEGHEVSGWIHRDFPATGGHAGFATGGFPGHGGWMPQRVLGFFAEYGGPAAERSR